MLKNKAEDGINSSTPIVILLFFLLSLSFACKNEVVHTANASVPIDSLITLSDAENFELLQEYIQQTGEHDRISASAIAEDTSIMIDYYTLKRYGWKITKDHHSRIYFSFDGFALGNIFLDGDSIHAEPNYIGPKENIDTLNEIISPMKRLYDELLEEAIKNHTHE